MIFKLIKLLNLMAVTVFRGNSYATFLFHLKLLKPSFQVFCIST